MIEAGKWVPRFPERRRNRSFHAIGLLAINRPWGLFASEFLKCFPRDERGNKIPDSKPFRKKLQGFVNNRLGEPIKEHEQHVGEDSILKHRRDYDAGTCPVQPIALVITADLQVDSIYWVVRAWCQDESSYQIAYGHITGNDVGAVQVRKDPRLPDPAMEFGEPDAEQKKEIGKALRRKLLKRLHELSERTWTGPDGSQLRLTKSGTIPHRFIDSGAWASDVYAFCLEHNWVATKGRSGDAQQKDIRADKAKTEGVQLLSFNTDFFKTQLQGRFSTALGEPGSWSLPRQCGTTYSQHLTAEEYRQITDQFGEVRWRWVNPDEKPNHLWDCEVLQEMASSLLKVTQRKVPYGNIATIPAPLRVKEPLTTPDGRPFFVLER
jgi:phage terminase large subunit GpA-like protein